MTAIFITTTVLLLVVLSRFAIALGESRERVEFQEKEIAIQDREIDDLKKEITSLEESLDLRNHNLHEAHKIIESLLLLTIDVQLSKKDILRLFSKHNQPTPL